jgi:hypothetical protein
VGTASGLAAAAAGVVEALARGAAAGTSARAAVSTDKPGTANASMAKAAIAVPTIGRPSLVVAPPVINLWFASSTLEVSREHDLRR